MTEQEKRFKVTKIVKYNDQILTLKRKIYINKLLVFAFTGMACQLISRGMLWTTSDVYFWMGNIPGFLSILGSLSFLENMITAISKKTILESEVENLKNGLDSEDLDKELRLYDSANKVLKRMR